MGYQRDQTYPGPTVRQESLPARRAYPNGPPPPLPPRAASGITNYYLSSPPAYEDVHQEYHSQPLTHSWTAQDPRSSSTQSLVPDEARGHGKRTLLLIYIHGFMGNETSFQSFPAHVHNLVTSKLANTHVVHTKIYPKYKSRRAIQFAADDFSNWLCPHESSDTDVILLGHSMGGILSAEVVLLPPYSPKSKDILRHRILGTINFDTPFLGMHPGVIASGIGSLFRPAPKSPELRARIHVQDAASIPTDCDPVSSSHPQEELQIFSSSEYFPPNTASDFGSNGAASASEVQSRSTALSPSVVDPNYNPPFPNDIRIPTRTGWNNALHFINKHSDGLTKATKSYVTSHLEFGGAMADYNGLKARYTKLRALEDVKGRVGSQQSSRRVRFVNYYTVSTGRPKKEFSPVRRASRQHTQQLDDEEQELEQDVQNMSLSSMHSRSPSRSPRISVEEYRDGVVVAKELLHPDEEVLGMNGDDDSIHHPYLSDASRSMAELDPRPVTGDEDQEHDGSHKSVTENCRSTSPVTLAETLSSETVDPPLVNLTPVKTLSFPPLPPAPTPPTPFEPSLYPDKDTRKIAQNGYSRQLKTYQRAVKDRDKGIKDRRKLVEKRERAAKLAREKIEKNDEKERIKEEKSMAAKLQKKPIARSEAIIETESPEANKPEKAKRDKKFCMLPSKVDGERDACWVRVFMKDVDEVGAHCGLFVVGPQYQWLVSNVGERIEEWIKEAGN